MHVRPALCLYPLPRFGEVSALLSVAWKKIPTKIMELKASNSRLPVSSDRLGTGKTSRFGQFCEVPQGKF
jgi:hypothetical protein